MPRQKLGPRVNGPYFDAVKGKYKLRVFRSYADPGSDEFYDTQKAAHRAKAALTEELSAPVSRVLDHLLVEYMNEKEQRGRAKPEICTDQLRGLRILFRDCLDHDIAKLTPRRAAALYERVSTEPKADGEPRRAATHHFYLELAQCFCRWLVRKGYLSVNPFKDVEPIGRVSVGKKQLRLEEAKLYSATAFRLFDEKADVMALASVIPLYLGLRASEVLRRKVRDVDAGGALLWIDAGKTKHARRHIKVEAPALRERLSRLTKGRDPDDLLFGLGKTGKPRKTQVLWSAVQRICATAGVPRVCPHSFRGLWATLSVESGAASSAVATALGHGSFEVTARHYAQPEALVNARSARMVDMLHTPSDPQDQLIPEQIVERLSPAALAKLVELIHRSVPSVKSETSSLPVP